MSRQDFEKLKIVQEVLEENKPDLIIFNEEHCEYEAALYTTFVPEYIYWLNGAYQLYNFLNGDDNE